MAKPSGTGSIRAAIEFNAKQDDSSVAAASIGREKSQDFVRQTSKIPKMSAQCDTTNSVIDLTLNAIPVVLNPEQCGKSATSANGVTTDRATTPVTRLKGVRVGLVDDEVLGSMVETRTMLFWEMQICQLIPLLQAATKWIPAKWLGAWSIPL